MTDANPPQPTPQAVALHYDGEQAPIITASGEYQLAEDILAIAREYKIPIYENPELVNVLAQMELGESIPEALYLAIAEIIAFAYYISGKSPTR